MPPYGLYSLANTPEELLNRGYGYSTDIPYNQLSDAEENLMYTKYDPAFGNLNTDFGYFSAPYTGAQPFQNASFLRGERLYDLGFSGDIDIPSFGGASNINYNQFEPEEVATGIMKKAQPFEFLSSAYEDKDEDAEQVDYLPGQEPSGIEKLLQYIPFVGDKSLSGNLLRNLLPQQDPRAIGIRNFYSPYEGLTSTGSIASGIMKGYNPVSGGFLNKITGGRFGQPTNYGLAGAMQRRIENILGRKIAQTDASRARVAELRNLQRAEMQDRADRGESLASIGKSTFSGPGMAFAPKTNTFSGGKTKTTGGVPGGKYGSPK